jgi:hypothetical protein
MPRAVELEKGAIGRRTAYVLLPAQAFRPAEAGNIRANLTDPDQL